MPVSDLDIARSAHQWIQLHGDAAIARAREMVEAMRAKGDEAGADTWLRIIVAIGELGTRRQTRGIDASAAQQQAKLSNPGQAWRSGGG